MLKTSEGTESKTRSNEGGVEIGGSKARRGGCEIDGREIDDVEVDGVEVEIDEIGKKVQKFSKSKNSSKSKKTVRSSDILIPEAKLVFIKLRQVFLKASILYYFDPEHHIWIETDELGYAIVGVPSQLTSDDLGR